MYIHVKHVHIHHFKLVPQVLLKGIKRCYTSLHTSLLPCIQQPKHGHAVGVKEFHVFVRVDKRVHVHVYVTFDVHGAWMYQLHGPWTHKSHGPRMFTPLQVARASARPAPLGTHPPAPRRHATLHHRRYASGTCTGSRAAGTGSRQQQARA